MFAEVLLPVPIYGTFTYLIPAELENKLAVGHRVVVPFGRRKSYTGIVTALTPVAPADVEVKKISLLLDEEPVVRHPQVKFWNWLADYYLCTPGEVYRAAVPAGLKVESETFISPVKGWEPDDDKPLSASQRMVLEGLWQCGEQKIMLDKLARQLEMGNITPDVTSLLDRGAVMISENLVERYHARKEKYVRIAFDRSDRDALQRVFESVKKGVWQEPVLVALLELSGFMRATQRELREVTRTELMERTGAPSTVFAAMAKKGIVECYTKEISRFASSGAGSGVMPVLSDAQSMALKEIHASWRDKPVTLLHGVTSSGKTEIYIHLINSALASGRQALFLVPEIALTTQLTGRLQRVFGEKVVIYHSKFTDNERVDIWKKLLRSSEPCVVIGPRSAVFLPFASLGLVIVDEEHESSYKQQDPAPRYNGRDAAIVLASMHGAKTLLGSATPSIETYYKAVNGRFGLVELAVRYGGVKMPEIELVDMTAARKKGQVDGIFSAMTRRSINEAIADGHQAILFLNRRGYSPVARCKMCGYVPRCRHCDVSLTYHRRADKLQCHYCGTPYDVPTVCPACGEPAIEVLGYGTERIEEDLKISFPGVPVSRMDLDTTRNKDGYENIIEEFSQGKTKLLVGTQMVTKGLDFDNVAVVSVVNADSILNFPDFRSAERAFNMIEQVAGRAGRKDGQGVVTVQTYTPDNPLFQFLKAHDYKGFYAHELKEREQFSYPPFARVIYIYLKHKDVDAVAAAATAMARRLYELIGRRVSGPDEPMVARVQNYYIRRIMLKIENSASVAKVKALLRQVKIELAAKGLLGGTVIYQDVDPV